MTEHGGIPTVFCEAERFDGGNLRLRSVLVNIYVPLRKYFDLLNEWSGLYCPQLAQPALSGTQSNKETQKRAGSCEVSLALRRD